MFSRWGHRPIRANGASSGSSISSRSSRGVRSASTPNCAPTGYLETSTAVLWRGYIDAGDYKQFIFPLLFYKRLCDVFDEEVAVALAESGGDHPWSHPAGMSARMCCDPSGIGLP